MVDIIIWLVLGLIAGAIAKFIMPGKDPGGFFVTIGIGILGAFIGGEVGEFLQLDTTTDGSLHFGSIATAVFGALILLGVLRLIRR